MTDISDNAKALQAVFLEEASEILEDIERDLLDLETSPGNRTLVDGLFRHLHTMKGSAGVAGMEELAHYTHAVESMLDEVRKRSDCDVLGARVASAGGARLPQGIYRGSAG